MTDNPTHRELDAKLEAVEARTQTQFERLDAKIERLSDAIVGDRGLANEIRTIGTQVRADNKFTRWTIMVTAITAVLGTVALVVNIQSTLLTAFGTALAAHPAAAASAAPK